MRGQTWSSIRLVDWLHWHCQSRGLVPGQGSTVSLQRHVLVVLNKGGGGTRCCSEKVA